MFNDWMDRLSDEEVDRIMREEHQRTISRRMDHLMPQYEAIDVTRATGFYEAMRAFIKLRDKLFAPLPIEPAWKILIALAQTEPDSPKSSVTGIAYGAEVPVTTVLRCLAAMEIQGIIERIPHATDRRQSMIRLTPEGRQRLDALEDAWKARIALYLCVFLAGLTFAAVSYAT